MDSLTIKIEQLHVSDHLLHSLVFYGQIETKNALSSLMSSIVEGYIQREHRARMSSSIQPITENDFGRSLVTFQLYPTVISEFLSAGSYSRRWPTSRKGHTDSQGQSYCIVMNLLLAILHRCPSFKLGQQTLKSKKTI